MHLKIYSTDMPNQVQAQACVWNEVVLSNNLIFYCNHIHKPKIHNCWEWERGIMITRKYEH
jgi:hypothetical protein